MSEFSRSKRLWYELVAPKEMRKLEAAKIQTAYMEGCLHGSRETLNALNERAVTDAHAQLMVEIEEFLKWE